MKVHNDASWAPSYKQSMLQKKCISHRYGHSPVCTRKCTLRLVLLWKDFIQTLHGYGCSLLCTRKCIVRPPLVLNVFLQKMQEYGHYSVCTHTCLMRLCCMNDWLQTLPGYGHSPVCTHTWTVTSTCWWKDFLHKSQEYGHSLLCIHICTEREFWWVKTCLHTSHSWMRYMLHWYFTLMSFIILPYYFTYLLIQSPSSPVQVKLSGLYPSLLLCMYVEGGAD